MRTGRRALEVTALLGPALRGALAAQRGVRKLDLLALERIARAFGVPPLRLLRHVKD